MYFSKLSIKNFRAIRKLELNNLSETIVIAGPNGCGKSCVFHSIRLLKSAYGGYREREWEQWFNEFNIRTNTKTEIKKLFRDKEQNVEIAATLSLTEREERFLRDRGKKVIEDGLWRRFTRSDGYDGQAGPRTSADYRNFGTEVLSKADQEYILLLDELEKDEHALELLVTPLGDIHTTRSITFEILFSLYLPKDVGVIDYHSDHRHYAREIISGINLRVKTSTDKFREHALYNHKNKYTNIKSELAASYIRELIIREGGEEERLGNGEDLNSTLTELFDLFFPGKSFSGAIPTPDGGLDFPVKLASGATHDINELSSGEKEILYGYLRLRNTEPRNSILLLEEPELHLNPRLIRGLPQFYHKHLGRNFDNQIWIVTHSDALLRESVGQPGFSVYHMRSPLTKEEFDNQVYKIEGEEKLENAILDLVGDLATYRPGAKLVIFEGENSEFDQRMTIRLFPELEEQINPISAGNKRRVQDLYELLSHANEEGHLGNKIFAIVDRDLKKEIPVAEVLSWDVYHIENYLLEPNYIKQVLIAIKGNNDLAYEDSNIMEILENCASLTMIDLVRHEMEAEVNQLLVSNIKTNSNRKAKSVAPTLYDAIDESLKRLNQLNVSTLSKKALEAKEEEIRKKYNNSLATSQWKFEFRGRDILKCFASKIVPEVKYEVFRNLIIDRMVQDEYRPEGMAQVIAEILNDD